MARITLDNFFTSVMENFADYCNINYNKILFNILTEEQQNKIILTITKTHNFIYKEIKSVCIDKDYINKTTKEQIVLMTNGSFEDNKTYSSCNFKIPLVFAIELGIITWKDNIIPPEN